MLLQLLGMKKIILNRSLCSNESNMRYWGRWEGLVQRVSSVLIVVDYIRVLIWIEWYWWNRWCPSQVVCWESVEWNKLTEYQFIDMLRYPFKLETLKIAYLPNNPLWANSSETGSIASGHSFFTIRRVLFAGVKLYVSIPIRASRIWVVLFRWCDELTRTWVSWK